MSDHEDNANLECVVALGENQHRFFLCITAFYTSNRKNS